MKNLNHLVSLLQEGYTTVAVSFTSQPIPELSTKRRGESQPAPWTQEPVQPQGMLYTYKSQFSDLKVGDLVIVPPTNEGKFPSVAIVAEVHAEPQLNFENGIEYKWLVGKVDTQGYADIMEKERKMMSVLRDSERARQRKELLDAYQLSLPDDPESRKLFNEARMIGGQIIEGK